MADRRGARALADRRLIDHDHAGRSARAIERGDAARLELGLRGQAEVRASAG
jgi:hypothetical protein